MRWPDWAASIPPGKRFGAQSSLLRTIRKHSSTSGSHRSAPGEPADAVASLKQATQLDPTSVNAYRGLLEIHRRDGKLEEALTVAMRVEERLPDDPIATLDVAELCLELGRVDQSAAAFQRLRALDDDPEHEVYAYHGLIEVEIRRGALAPGSRSRRRRDAGRPARAYDGRARVRGRARSSASDDRPGPSREEVDAALAASRAEHRRLHAEALVV